MQYRNLAAVALAGNALAAYVPSEPWSTLTPSATLAHGTTEYTGSFGIAINPIPTTASSSALVLSNSQNEGKAAAATQIADGQIQATTGTSNEILTKTTTLAQAVTQIGDGQIQATTATATKETVQAVTQIGDGQIQATTATAAKVTVQAVTQIGDGQIQATTATAAKVTVQAVTQIGDGQIQATTATATKETVQAVTQIGDGQVQATTATSAKETVQAATQIGDGQVQASTSTEKPTGTAATQIGDGQVQASASASVIDSGIKYEACASNGTLSMTLHDGILTDVKGRIGSIVANQQFQFDGPPPQAGAIYAAGWSISDDGKLAIGNSTTFYQCLSGDFYNLYAEDIGTKCEAVELDIVELVTC